MTRPVPEPRRSDPGSERARKLAPGTLVSVIIPCFDEERVLPLLFERLQHVAQGWGTDYEIVLVDDGSTDRTWPILNELHHRDPRWKLVRFGRNFGHQTAIRAGLEVCRGDVVAVLDADLQDPPEVLVEFFDKWVEGYDVVYGVRRRRKEGLVKRSLYYLFYRVLSRLSEFEVPLDAGDFCVMDRRVVDFLTRMPEHKPFIRGLRSWVGFRQLAHPYDREPRAAGAPKYSTGRLVGLAVDGLLGSSTVPLRLATYFGALMSVVAFLGAVLVLSIRLLPEFFAEHGIYSVPGTATVMVSVLLLGGVQLLSLGILGEYLGRIFENVKGRPLWTVRDTVGLPENAVDRLDHASRSRDLDR